LSLHMKVPAIDNFVNRAIRHEMTVAVNLLTGSTG
jgi:hypothetical protein